MINPPFSLPTDTRLTLADARKFADLLNLTQGACPPMRFYDLARLCAVEWPWFRWSITFHFGQGVDEETPCGELRVQARCSGEVV